MTVKANLNDFISAQKAAIVNSLAEKRLLTTTEKEKIKQKILSKD